MDIGNVLNKVKRQQKDKGAFLCTLTLSLQKDESKQKFKWNYASLEYNKGILS